MRWRVTLRRLALGTAVGRLGLLAAFGALELRQGSRHRTGSGRPTHAAELKVCDAASTERFDFEQTGIEGWKNVDGRNAWMEGARRAQGA